MSMMMIIMMASNQLLLLLMMSQMAMMTTTLPSSLSFIGAVYDADADYDVYADDYGGQG